MSLSITLGWWLLPLAFTVAVWVWGLWPDPRDYNRGDYSFPIIWLVKAVVALVTTLFVWVIYLAAALIWGQS